MILAGAGRNDDARSAEKVNCVPHLPAIGDRLHFLRVVLLTSSRLKGENTAYDDQSNKSKN